MTKRRGRPLGRLRGGLAGLALLIGLAGPALALEARLEMAEGDLRDAVASGSLVLAAAGAAPAGVLDVVAAARADYANILSILYGAGYYGGTIHIRLDGREVADLSPFVTPASLATVVVTVDPGPRFAFGRAVVAPLAPGTALPEGFAPGKPAQSEVIRSAVGAAVDGWRGTGHAKARPADRRITANHPTATLDAEVAIAPGPRLTFGRLTVAGNEAVRTARIHEIAGLRTGRVFSPEDLDTVARRLRQTGAFKSVALEEAETPNPDGSLDIGVTLVEEAPRRFGIGAEISSFEGLALTGFWMHRNIFGGAERLRFDAEVRGIQGDTGGIDYRIAASFARPATFSPANTLNLRAEFAVLDEPDYFQRLAGVEANIAREISARTKYSFGLGFEYSEVSDDLGDRTFALISLPLTAEHDRRDNPLNPRTGFYLKAEATPFYDLRSASAGGRLLGDARYYHTLGQDGPVTLAGRVQAGSILGAGLAEVPPDMLFFSGGGGTVRGQPYQSLNVPLGGGDFTGGRNLLVVSAEVRVRTGAKLSVVGFADYGFVGAGSVPGSDGASHAGAGLGLRYDTPIGPIRLDIAAPVSGATSSGVQVYVGIGQAF